MLIAVTLALSLGAFSIVVGQRVGGAGGTVKDPKSGRDPSSAPRPTNPTVKTVYKTRVERVTVTPTTGSLSVAAESNATILVEPIKIRNAQGQQGIVPAGEGILSLMTSNQGATVWPAHSLDITRWKRKRLSPQISSNLPR